MNAFERYFFRPVSAVRPYLLVRLLLGLLAFDCWLDLVPHGARYGAGEFNVAHFAFIDALHHSVLPLPSPALYVGMMLLTGWLALTMALSKPTRLGLGVVTALYTWGWAMSMLDSYQHHYLISIVLTAMCFMPMPTGRELYGETDGEVIRPLVHTMVGIWLALAGYVWLAAGADDDGNLFASMALLVISIVVSAFHQARVPDATPRHAPLVRAWAYMLFCVSCALVYFFTAITKTNADWRDGHALRRLTQGREAPTALMQWFQSHIEGLTAAEFWSGFAKFAILGQLAIALGFVLLATQDRWKRWRWRRLMPFMILAPLLFHAGAEKIGLEIGWFSDYMILIAIVVFMPEEILDIIARVGSSLGRWFETGPLREFGQIGAMKLSGVALITGGVSAALLYEADLPGAPAVAVCAALFLAAQVTLLVRGKRAEETHTEDPTATTARATTFAASWVLAGPLSALLLLLALGQTDVRWDYYRKAGGTCRRRATDADPELYLCAMRGYELAQRYRDRSDDSTDRSHHLQRMRAEVARLRAAGRLPAAASTSNESSTD